MALYCWSSLQCVNYWQFRIKENWLLLNLIKHQHSDIDFFYLYVKDPFLSNYQLHINKKEKVGTKALKSPKACNDYSQTIHFLWKYYNPIRNMKVLIVFGDMIAGTESNLNCKSYCYWIFKKKKTQYFACFYIPILCRSA